MSGQCLGRQSEGVLLNYMLSVSYCSPSQVDLRQKCHELEWHNHIYTWTPPLSASQHGSAILDSLVNNVRILECIFV
jgi:hypothetical protein